MEVGLSVALVTCALLVAQRVVRESRVTVGFDYHNLASVDIAALGGRDGGAMASVATLQSMLSTLPSVLAVTSGRVVPWDYRDAITSGDSGALRRSIGTRGRVGFVSRTYFAVLGIHPLLGRLPDATDGGAEKTFAVLSRAAAEKLFPSSSPIGKTVRVDSLGRGALTLTVVAVVEDVRQNLVTETSPSPTVYTFVEGPGDEARLWIKFSAWRLFRPDLDLAADVQRLVHDGRVARVSVVEQAFSAQLDRIKSPLLLFVPLAVLAVLLASAGVYALATLAMASRRREIGIRVALGAPQRSVVLRETLPIGLIAIVGIVSGSVLGWVATAAQLVRDPAFGERVSATAFGATLVGAIVAAALFRPAVAASRERPADILRAL
jgi:hypothetical protein